MYKIYILYRKFREEEVNSNQFFFIRKLFYRKGSNPGEKYINVNDSSS